MGIDTSRTDGRDGVILVLAAVASSEHLNLLRFDLAAALRLLNHSRQPSDVYSD